MVDSTIQLFKITKPFLHADWSRAMFNKSEDHGNDVMVAQLICFSLSCVCVICWEPSMEMDIKTVNVIVKNKLTTISKGYILMDRSHGP